MTKTEKIRIDCPFLDRRAKLLPCQKEMVFVWYRKGLAKRAIARMFNVDRRLIDFILFPEKLEANKLKRQERGGTKQYYDKEYNTIKKREYRRRKNSTFKDLVQGGKNLPQK